MASSHAPRIARLSVTGLFGAFDYRLPTARDDALGETVILYGDNGCGKTTLLQLVFHMLSPADNRGHRNALSQTPFKQLDIQMTNGFVFSAFRAGDVLTGPYELSVTKPDGEKHRCYYDPRREERLTPREQWKHYLSNLSSLGLLVYLLSDERSISSDAIETPSEPELFERVVWMSRRDRPSPSSSLDDTIAMVNQWVSRQAARGANEGDQNVNSIYTDIIRRLTDQERATDVTSSREQLATTLRELSARSDRFAEYRLVSALRAEQIIELIDKASEYTLTAIVSVLQPYLDSTKARLDALDDIQRIVRVFVTSFAEFYTHKHVVFDVVDGLRVFADNGGRLAPQQLSSGERQLLRLFCYTLVSRDNPSIFIIDEPELSLNIKWQRKLIRALNSFVEGTDNQFLFATHSIEILAQHRRAVVPLKPAPYSETKGRH